MTRPIEGALSDGSPAASTTCEQRARSVNWAHHSTRRPSGTNGHGPGARSTWTELALERPKSGSARPRGQTIHGASAAVPAAAEAMAGQLLTVEASARKLGTLPVHPALADVPSPSTRARARRLVSMAQADSAVLTLVRLGLHLSASASPHSIRATARAAGASAAAPREDALHESCGPGPRPGQRLGRALRLPSSAEPAQPLAYADARHIDDGVTSVKQDARALPPSDA